MASDDQKISGVAGRYASALFELASETKAQKAVGEDLARFREMVDGSEDLQRLVRSPVFKAADQIAAELAMARLAPCVLRLPLTAMN